MADLETASRTETPADVPTPAAEPIGKPANGSDGADQHEARKCKTCDKDALPKSMLCQEHQDEIALVAKKPRLLRLDVILVAVIALLAWARPNIWTPVWQTASDQGVWETIYAFFAGVEGRKNGSRADANGPSKGDQNSLAAGNDVEAAVDGPAAQSADAVRARNPARGVAHASRAVCGNGIVEPGEQCDGSALGGASCAALGFSGDCGNDASCLRASLACLGDCRFDYIGCTAASQAAVQRFVDHHNGTATDRLTGLVWELKCAAGDCEEPNDVVTKLPWREAGTGWIGALNDARFGGHDDWRLPSLEELRTLLAAVPPCTAPTCPATALSREAIAPAGYWSSTSFSLDRNRAWAISFGDGEAYTAEKDAALHVRAVRSESRS